MLRVVEHRFGPAPAGIVERLAEAQDLARLEALLDLAITAPGIEVVQATLDQVQ